MPAARARGIRPISSTRPWRSGGRRPRPDVFQCLSVHCDYERLLTFLGSTITVNVANVRGGQPTRQLGRPQQRPRVRLIGAMGGVPSKNMFGKKNETVNGYKLGPVLGEGGFASVRKATSPEGVEVAFKQIATRKTDEATYKREVELLKMVGIHRHVCSLVDKFATDNCWIIVSELAGGGEARAPALITVWSLIRVIARPLSVVHLGL